MTRSPLFRGLLGSGAALITHTLYRMMFGGPIPEAQASYLANEEALVKLIGDKSVDVVVVAAGQPAPLIANMRPEAQKYIKLLKFDPQHPSSKQPLTVYSYATVNVASYPHLIKEPFTTIAVVLEVMLAVEEGRLDQVELKWDPRPALCVVASSKGYPGSYPTGVPISGIDDADSIRDVKVFHSGTARKDNQIVTDGGRVLAVTALGNTIADAQKRAYQAMSKIHFDGMHIRKDIGWRAMR